MVGCWTRFAANGNPNGHGSPAWLRFGPIEYVRSLAPGRDGIQPVDLGREHHRGFWARQAAGPA